MIVHLVVVYPETYPDVIPELSFENIEVDEDDEDSEPTGELTEEEDAKLVEALNAVVSHLLAISEGTLICRRKRV